MPDGGASPRLLIYSQDGFGLGHLRRTTLLAAEFLASRPGASVLTISDSPVGRFFATSLGHDYLKLPSIRKVSAGNWLPVSLALDFPEVLELRRDVIRTAAVAFDPDVFLVDHMPHGAMGELLPTLAALEGRQVRTVLGLRDILDAPATVRRRWDIEGAFAAVERYFDDVLVFGSRDVFDVAEEYAWPGPASSRLRYCGYVSAPATVSSPDDLRAQLLGDDVHARLVVAMAGGGADGYPLFDALVRAAPALAAAHGRLVVVTGPFLPEEDQAALHRLAEGLPVRVVPVVSDSLAYLDAADLVVAMAGYNTTMEILSLGKRALLVPRAGPSAEQRMRASRFADRGWVRWLPPEALSPASIGAALVEALDESPAVVVPPDLTGRQRAVSHLLAGEPAPAPAPMPLVADATLAFSAG